MQTTLRTLGCAVILSSMATSAMAVLPTVALDPADPATQPTSNLTLAPAQSAVMMPSTTITAAPVTLSTGTVSTGTVLPMSNVTVSSPISATPTMSASTTQIQKRLLASLVGRDATGKESLAPITAQTKIMPGNIIEYHGYVINRSPDRVRNVKATFALPANTILTGLPDMSPSRAYGSIDGVNFFYMPLKSNVGGVMQEVPLSSYKAVRWDIQGLGLNEVAEVKFRVRVK